LEGIIPLKAPVPPMLSDAIGYTGKERFVAFQWTPWSVRGSCPRIWTCNLAN
jgi:hypothetical protein